MKIDPRNIRYLLAIAEHGSLVAASRAEGISQPALSNKIALLERQLGVRIMERGRHGAVLNRYGQLLLRRARALESLLGSTLEEIDLEKNGLQGPLTVGATPLALLHLVPAAVARLTASGQRISISLIESDDEQLLDKLQAGEIDLMLGSLGNRSGFPDLMQEHLVEFPIMVAVGAASSLWPRKVVSLDRLMDAQWAMPAVGNVFRSHLEAVFLNSGVPFPKSFWSCGSMTALKALVQHTDCVTMMPREAFALEAEAGVLRGIRLRNLAVNRAVAVMRSRSWPLSPVAERFLAALRHVARTMN